MALLAYNHYDFYILHSDSNYHTEYQKHKKSYRNFFSIIARLLDLLLKFSKTKLLSLQRPVKPYVPTLQI